MIRRCAALLAAVLAALSVSVTTAAADAARPAVVVVGVPGLRWDQVSAISTPTLWRLAHTGSVGSLSIRSGDAVTCPDEGWLTVGAGNRVVAGRGSGCAAAIDAAPQGNGARIGSYPAIVQRNLDLNYAAIPGIVASSLAPATCVASVGLGVIGAADRDGRVPYASQSLQDLTHCPVTMVGLGVVTDKATAGAVDKDLATVDHNRPAGSVLLVVGLSDTDPHDRAHLHVAIATGGPYTAGALRSQSTRRAPFVQLIDVAATVLELRGVAQSSHIDGQPWRTSGHRAPSVSSLADQDTAAGAAGAALPWVVVFLVVLVVAGSALALTARRRVAALVLLVALSAPVMTYLVNLVPWYRSPSPTLVTMAATLVLAGGLAALAFRIGEKVSWVVAAGVVAGVTFAVVALDLLTGARLQLDSVLGYSPLVAGRFAGVGNVGYGVLASSAVLAATTVAIKRPGWRAVAVIGVLAVIVDGAPMWGSDVGGVLALIPGFGVLLLLTARVRVSLWRLLAVGLLAVAVVVVFALADYSRPAADQTHLGRFIGKVLHGGAGTIIDRKWNSDVDLLILNPATLTVPLVIAVSLWLILRPRPRLARTYARHPELRFGLISLSVVALVGLVVNDSGVAIPAVAVLLAVPYTLVSLTGDTSPEPPPGAPHVLP